MAFRFGAAGFGGHVGAVTTAAALTFAFTLGGCAAKDDSGSSAPAVTSARPAATTAARALKATDYVYTGGPETSGFEQEPGTDGPGSAERAELAGCENTFGSSPDSISWANGPTLTSGDATVVVYSEVDILPAKEVEDDVAAVRTQKFHDCLLEDVKGSAAGDTENPTQGTQVIDGVQERDVPLPDGAAARFSFAENQTTEGETTLVYTEFLLFGKGQVRSMAMVMSAQNPADDLVTAVAAQMVAMLDQQ
ncbi:hypothetical protein ACG83_12470 [Frankia sp. R43]|uniref:hypothetical protein n=1 Tax=Frankia sp. R43 TaxID=269536 RepID=UPI0006CA4E19|nr:hypothetical protein [Frankia sp. R43]KPM56000.1 hypothetical protein ACG83_12470 [Frankia sp. R43]